MRWDHVPISKQPIGVGSAAEGGSAAHAPQKQQQLRQLLAEKNSMIASLGADLAHHRTYIREITAFTLNVTNVKAEKMQLELFAAVKEQGRLETRPKEKEKTLFPQLRAERNQAVFQRDAVLANIQQY